MLVHPKVIDLWKLKNLETVHYEHKAIRSQLALGLETKDLASNALPVVKALKKHCQPMSWNVAGTKYKQGSPCFSLFKQHPGKA